MLVENHQFLTVSKRFPIDYKSEANVLDMFLQSFREPYVRTTYNSFTLSKSRTLLHKAIFHLPQCNSLPFSKSLRPALWPALPLLRYVWTNPTRCQRGRISLTLIAEALYLIVQTLWQLTTNLCRLTDCPVARNRKPELEPTLYNMATLAASRVTQMLLLP